MNGGAVMLSPSSLALLEGKLRERVPAKPVLPFDSLTPKADPSVAPLALRSLRMTKEPYPTTPNLMSEI
jgi:hypothetical protein